MGGRREPPVQSNLHTDDTMLQGWQSQDVGANAQMRRSGTGRQN